jgi:glucokinase
MILVGDIGGTNARFGLASKQRNNQYLIREFSKVSADKFPSLDEAINDYLNGLGTHPDHAVLAVAGPVSNGRVSFTNRDWSISQSDLQDRCAIKSVEFINDFTAMARSVPEMSADSFIDIHPGNAVAGAPVLVAGPGTGFGTATLLPIGDSWRVLPGEGGHMAYAPQSDEELEVFKILRDLHGYISVELVCAGKGLEKLHQAVCIRHKTDYVPSPAYAILERAEQGDAICAEVCRIRTNTLMVAIASGALLSGAKGGIVLAGGVAKRLVDYISNPQSLERFFACWPESDFLKNIPIRLLTNPTAPLVGAAAHLLAKDVS